MGKDKSQIFTAEVPAVFLIVDKATSIALNTTVHGGVRHSRGSWQREHSITAGQLSLGVSQRSKPDREQQAPAVGKPRVSPCWASNPQELNSSPAAGMPCQAIGRHRHLNPGGSFQSIFWCIERQPRFIPLRCLPAEFQTALSFADFTFSQITAFRWQKAGLSDESSEAASSWWNSDETRADSLCARQSWEQLIPAQLQPAQRKTWSSFSLPPPEDVAAASRSLGGKTYSSACLSFSFF